MKYLLSRLTADESGATVIEYGLIVALIAMGIMIGFGQVTSSVQGKFTGAATSIDAAGN